MAGSQKKIATHAVELSKLSVEKRKRAAERLKSPQGCSPKKLPDGWQARIFTEVQKHGPLTQADLAFILQVSVSTVGKIQRDELDPRHDELVAVIEQARGELHSTLATEMLKIATNKGNNQYQAVQWCLQKWYADQYSDKAATVNVNVAHQLPAPLPPEEYAKLFQQKPALPQPDND